MEALITAVVTAVGAHPRIRWPDTTAETVTETGSAMRITTATGTAVTAGQVVLAAGVLIPALLRRSHGLDQVGSQSPVPVLDRLNRWMPNRIALRVPNDPQAPYQVDAHGMIDLATSSKNSSRR
jgi:hypothetical protein